MSDIVINGNCKCCTYHNDAKLEVTKSREKIILEITDCMGHSKIEIDKSALALLGTFAEMDDSKSTKGETQGGKVK